MMNWNPRIAAFTSAVLATSMTFIDATALNQALPVIGDSLRASASELLWMVGAYTITLAALLLPAGVLADRSSHRGTLARGLVLFMAASAACAFAPGAPWMIGMRAAQGMGGAMMVTGSLAVLTAAYVPSERGRAIGAWSAWCAAATVAGPLLGGALAQLGLWRGIFLINLPLGLVTLVSLRHVDAARVENTAERAARRPVWRVPAVRSAAALTLILDTALYGLLLVLPLALIAGSGYRADHAALAQMALVLLLIGACPIGGRWMDQRGPRAPVCAGCGLAALGHLWLAIGGMGEGPDEYLLRLLGPLALIGAGMGLAIVGLSTTMMNSVGEHALGTGAALNALVARSASALSVVVFGGLLLERGVDLTTGGISTASWPPTSRAAMLLAALLCATAAALALRLLDSLRTASTSSATRAPAAEADR